MIIGFAFRLLLGGERVPCSYRPEGVRDGADLESELGLAKRRRDGRGDADSGNGEKRRCSLRAIRHRYLRKQGERVSDQHALEYTSTTQHNLKYCFKYTTIFKTR